MGLYRIAGECEKATAFAEGWVVVVTPDKFEYPKEHRIASLSASKFWEGRIFKTDGDSRCSACRLADSLSCRNRPRPKYAHAGWPPRAKSSEPQTLLSTTHDPSTHDPPTCQWPMNFSNTCVSPVPTYSTSVAWWGLLCSIVRNNLYWSLVSEYYFILRITLTFYLDYDCGWSHISSESKKSKTFSTDIKCDEKSRPLFFHSTSVI